MASSRRVASALMAVAVLALLVAACCKRDCDCPCNERCIGLLDYCTGGTNTCPTCPGGTPVPKPVDPCTQATDCSSCTTVMTTDAHPVHACGYCWPLKGSTGSAICLQAGPGGQPAAANACPPDPNGPRWHYWDGTGINYCSNPNP